MSIAIDWSIAVVRVDPSTFMLKKMIFDCRNLHDFEKRFKDFAFAQGNRCTYGSPLREEGEVDLLA